MKINLGCGSTPLEEYINVDIDTVKDLRKRYPNREFSDELRIEQWDIFNLPLEDGSVDEVRADCFFEHLNFKEERLIFEESKRVLKIGGSLNLSVPDFETLVKQWLEAEDNWQDWYRDDNKAIEQKHWFGTYEYSSNNRWGHITASLFGSQNGEGQYHKNCYTIGKLRNIFKKLDFDMVDESYYKWPRGDTRIIKAIGKKR